MRNFKDGSWLKNLKLSDYCGNINQKCSHQRVAPKFQLYLPCVLASTVRGPKEPENGSRAVTWSILHGNSAKPAYQVDWNPTKKTPFQIFSKFRKTRLLSSLHFSKPWATTVELVKTVGCNCRPRQNRRAQLDFCLWKKSTFFGFRIFFFLSSP